MTKIVSKKNSRGVMMYWRVDAFGKKHIITAENAKRLRAGKRASPKKVRSPRKSPYPKGIKFCGPNRTYPVNTLGRARSAIAYSKKYSSPRWGSKLSKTEANKIQKCARKQLDKFLKAEGGKAYKRSLSRRRRSSKK